MNAVEIAQEKMERTAAARTEALGTPRYITARQAADEAKAEFIAAYNASKDPLPEPYRTLMVASIKERIAKETAQRAELVKWIAQIDATVAAANLDLEALS